MGPTAPGAGSARFVVRGGRMTEAEVVYHAWRCTGPRERPRQRLGWDAEVLRVPLPRVRPGRAFRMAHEEAGGGTYDRVLLTGRLSPDGRMLTGTFTRSTRGVTRYGTVTCRSPRIRFRAAPSHREFRGVTSQGVPVHLRLDWLASPMLEGSPMPFDGTLGRVEPGDDLVVTCRPPDREPYEVRMPAIGAYVDPASGRVGLISPTFPGRRPDPMVSLTGQAPALGDPGRVVRLTISVRDDPEQGCLGTATLRAEEVPATT